MKKKFSILLGILIFSLLLIVSTGAIEAQADDLNLLWGKIENYASDRDPEWGYGNSEGADSVIAVDNDYIYITGYEWDFDPFGLQWRIEKRRKSDGERIWSVVSDSGGSNSDLGYSITTTPADQYIYIAGMWNYNYWRVEKRRKSDGVLVGNRTGGNAGASLAAIQSITIDNAYIYTAGYDTPSCGSGCAEMRWRVEKLNKNLALQAVGTTDAPGQNIIGAYSITADDADFIYIAGQEEIGSDGDRQWRIEKRRKSDLTSVQTFTWNPSNISDGASSIVADGEFLYIGGVINNDSPTEQYCIDKRRKSDLGGVAGWPICDQNLLLPVITIDSNYIYLKGGWQVQRRSKVDGSLISSSPATPYFSYGSIAVDDTGLYLAGIESSLTFVDNNGQNRTDTRWYVEKRAKGAPISLPVVVTSEATGVQQTSVTLNGEITDTGGENCGERGFEWGTVSGSYPNSWTEPGSFGTGAFSRNITGLTAGTTYYYRAKAKNSIGWGYGLEQWVPTITSNQVPSANNLVASETTGCNSGADPDIFLNWTFDDPGDSQSAYQIQIDNSGAGFPSPEVNTGKVISSSNTYASNGLSFGTQYWWRVKVWDNATPAQESAWINAPVSFTTDPRWPRPNFTWDPLSPIVGEDVDFTNATQFCPGCSYDWDFDDGSPIDSSQDPTHAFLAKDNYSVTLTSTSATGSCNSSQAVNVGGVLPLPTWKEIPPF